MTFRVNSVYSSGAWGGSSSPYGYNSQQRSLSNDFGSVFGANSSYGYNDSMSFMPAPQGAADFKMPVPQNAANFKMPVPAGANIPGFTNPLTVNPFGRNRNCHNSNNPFQNHHGGAANMRYSSSRTSFGSLTSGNKLSSMNIHTPSVDYNSTTAKTPFGSLTKTNISGDIDSYKKSTTRVNTSNANLSRTREVIETPTETITRTRTRGTLWV